MLVLVVAVVLAAVVLAVSGVVVVAVVTVDVLDASAVLTCTSTSPNTASSESRKNIFIVI